MANYPSIRFSPFELPAEGTLIVLSGETVELAPSLPDSLRAAVKKAAAVKDFKGKALSSLEILNPAGSDLDRVVVLGLPAQSKTVEEDWLKLGGAIAAASKGSKAATVWVAGSHPDLSSARVAGLLALGASLRAYDFDRYKTKKDDDGNGANGRLDAELDFAVADPSAAQAAYGDREAVAQGVRLARDLVNEPANALGPLEFAERIQALTSEGVEVEILTEKEMGDLGMGALLGVAQGSVRPPRLAVMRWNGGAEGETPLAFVGKGVVFDSGGLSIKPAGGMEEMKGDMGGAAAVTGLMRALAGRKAKVNAIGIVGLVENMLDGNAQRPGDIVRTMAGKTVEVLNTDAEGRLVLADALWYCQDRFKPKFMIDLATLTGAIIVALGNHHAGLFSNNDELAERLTQAGRTSGEKVWRLPLGPEYDKMIDGKFADIKNIGGGRAGGAITAAQFLQRFVNDVPWAHLDIAGTAFSAPTNEYNQSWGSGFGVMLLNRLVEDHYETA